jgi:hypothetical protein
MFHSGTVKIVLGLLFRCGFSIELTVYAIADSASTAVGRQVRVKRGSVTRCSLQIFKE